MCVAVEGGIYAMARTCQQTHTPRLRKLSFWRAEEKCEKPSFCHNETISWHVSVYLCASVCVSNSKRARKEGEFKAYGRVRFCFYLRGCHYMCVCVCLCFCVRSESRPSRIRKKGKKRATSTRDGERGSEVVVVVRWTHCATLDARIE